MLIVSSVYELYNVVGFIVLHSEYFFSRVSYIQLPFSIICHGIGVQFDSNTPWKSMTHFEGKWKFNKWL